MYSVLDYGRMANDRVRMDAYARAIARTVRPGAVVLDLGAGTGILSLLAARAGARRVHAVDINPAVNLLREIAVENGFGEQIVVHHRSSYDLVLDEKVDVIISDLRGSSPLFADNIPLVRDAWRRLAKPDATLLPTRDRLFVALVENEQLSNRLGTAWTPFERLGLRAMAARTSTLNSVQSDAPTPVQASDLITSGACWATIEYAKSDSQHFEGSVSLPVRRPGVAHALALWFEATIHDDLVLTTAPGNALVYARDLLPLDRTFELAEGDEARVTLRADMRGGRWAWETALRDVHGTLKQHARQTSFFGQPGSLNDFLRTTAAHRPATSPRGERLRRALEAMNGERTIADLAAIARGGDGSDAVSAEAVEEELREAIERYAL